MSANHHLFWLVLLSLFLDLPKHECWLLCQHLGFIVNAAETGFVESRSRLNLNLSPSVCFSMQTIGTKVLGHTSSSLNLRGVSVLFHMDPFSPFPHGPIFHIPQAPSLAVYVCKPVWKNGSFYRAHRIQVWCCNRMPLSVCEISSFLHISPSTISGIIAKWKLLGTSATKAWSVLEGRRQQQRQECGPESKGSAVEVPRGSSRKERVDFSCITVGLLKKINLEKNHNNHKLY